MKFTLTDLIIMTAAGALLCGMCVPVVVHAREDAGIYKCLSNLRQIGQALSLYYKTHGEYPRTRHDPTLERWTQYTGAAAADPFASDGPQPNDVSAALFLLLRTQQLGPEVFVCPKTELKWLNHGLPPNTPVPGSNFPSGQHLGYSYANPYPTTASIQAGYRTDIDVSAEFALAADMNPGGADLLQLTATASSEQMRQGNSLNHGRITQVVLYGDGHADAHMNPFVGVQRDNIYTSGPSGMTGPGIGIVGSPVHASDSVLLPIAQVDPHPSRTRVERSSRILFNVSIAGAAAVTLVVMLRLLRRRRGNRSTAS